MTDLTPKQRMVLDYMRGNGCVLTTYGCQHLVRRGSFKTKGLSQVLAALWRADLIDKALYVHPERAIYRLTEKGKRA